MTLKINTENIAAPAEPTPTISAISVALVEDYVGLRMEMEDALTLRGFKVSVADHGEDLNAILATTHIDIIVSDLTLPGEDGLEIVTRVKKTMPNIGIVLVTGRVTTRDRSEGYTVGADVYLSKPVRIDELVAVLRNLYSRLNKGGNSDPIQHPVSSTKWVFHAKGSLLQAPSGETVPLTANESSLVSAFLLAHGQFIDTPKILELLKKNDNDAGRTQLEAMMSRFRRKISIYDQQNNKIQCEWGKGYRLLIDCQFS